MTTRRADRRQGAGNAPKLNDAQRQALVAIVESGPIPAIHGVVRWRLKDLAWWVFEEFGISLDETTVGRELRHLGYRRLSARPQHHAQNQAALEVLKKSPRPLGDDPGAAPDWHRHRAVVAEPALGLDLRNEARVGQNIITRRWAKRGTRPHAPHDQRTKSAYLFGAICPAKGKGAGLVMPWCDTQAMAEHLKEISLAVDPGGHAVVMLDQAGWHTSAKLEVPATSRCSRCRRAAPN